MSADLIRQILKTGECPVCKASIVSDEEMAGYFCSEDKSHFDLKVIFHGGEKIEAILNGKNVPEEDLKEIDW